MLTRVLSLLAITCLVACGTATSAAPLKTTNPPLVIKPETPTPVPPANDGPWVLAFKQIDIAIVLPNHRWKPELVIEDGGGTMMKADLAGTSITLFMKAYLNPKSTPLSVLIELHRQGHLADPSKKVSAVEDEGSGRLTFSVDTARDDGTPMRGRLYMAPSPNRSDGFFLMAIIGTTEDIEKYGQEAHGIIESLKPLPK